MFSMKTIYQFIMLIFATSISLCVFASPVDTYKFTDPVKKQRYQDLIEELRCPKCQNQNLADSNSPISQDLRKQVYDQIQQGKADQEIVDYMVYRYGEFILYRPKLNQKTYFLWFGPIVFIAFGAILMIIFVRRQKKQISTINEADKAELDALLRHENDQK